MCGQLKHLPYLRRYYRVLQRIRHMRENQFALGASASYWRNWRLDRVASHRICRQCSSDTAKSASFLHHHFFLSFRFRFAWAERSSHADHSSLSVRPKRCMMLRTIFLRKLRAHCKSALASKSIEAGLNKVQPCWHFSLRPFWSCQLASIALPRGNNMPHRLPTLSSNWFFLLYLLVNLVNVANIMLKSLI